MSPSHRSKSICIIMERFIAERIGGVEIQTYLMGKNLRQKGWRVVFVAGTSDKRKQGLRDHYKGIEVIWVKATWLFPFLNNNLYNVLLEIEPQIVYQRGRSYFTGSGWGRKFAKRYKRKLIYGCASDFDFEKFYLFRNAFNERKPLHVKLIALINGLFQDFQFHKTLKSADITVVQTEKQHEQFFNIYSKPSVLVLSGHELPKKETNKTSSITVFWIANTGRRKQLELFVDLARALQEVKAEFIIAGTIPHQDYWQEIQNRMAGLSNIRYIGPLNWDESNEWFAKSSVFVNTTLPNREGFPNTYIQAWMRETPVVTLHCDPDGVIEKHRLGFHSRSFEQMVADVRQLIENEELRKVMGNNARTYAIENHDINKTVEKLDQLFTDCLNMKS